MALAPIILFVYNRPNHTRLTLTALMQNRLASESSLYIFADGPKANCTVDQLDAINRTRQVLIEKQWCKNVEIVSNHENIGLAKSIVKGITSIIQLHGKIIVLEDDIVTSPYFLRYMNDALDLFENRADIGSVNAFAVDFLAKYRFPDYFLINNADCWGWATWKDRWADYILDASILKQQLIDQNKVEIFEYGGHMPLLNSQIKGDVDTWDIQWHAVNVLQNRKGVFARIPFIENIGQDGSGTHYTETLDGTKPIKKIKLNNYKITLPEFVAVEPLIYSELVERKFRLYYLRFFTTPFRKKALYFLKRLIKKKSYFK